MKIQKSDIFIFREEQIPDNEDQKLILSMQAGLPEKEVGSQLFSESKHEEEKDEKFHYGIILLIETII